MIKLLILLAIIIPGCALASDDYHEHHNSIVNNYTYYGQSDGVALALAVSAPQYDYNIEGFQLGLGGGYYETQNGDGHSAIAFGAGKRTCFSDSNCGMLNFTIGYEEGGSIGFNAGITWKL